MHRFALVVVALITARVDGALQPHRAPPTMWYRPALALRGADCRSDNGMRLRGGLEDLHIEDDDDLPEVEFKLNDAKKRFNVSLRFPFQIAMGGHAGEERWAFDGVRR